MLLSKRTISLLSLLALTIVASGCVSNSSANLNKDFSTETTPVELNQSGESLLDQAFSQKVENYSVDSKTQVLFNTPVTSFRINLTSEGDFMPERSNITSTTKIGLGGFSGDEHQEWPEKTVETSANTSKVTVSSEDNSTQKTVEPYNRTELGLSIEAFDEIRVEEAELVGATGENQSQLLLELNTSESELASNYATIFEVHAVNEEEEDASSQTHEELDSFNQTEAYAWINREEKNLERFAYFGSNEDGALQVRVDARFEN
jgi:hypothetical protein